MTAFSVTFSFVGKSASATLVVTLVLTLVETGCVVIFSGDFVAAAGAEEEGEDDSSSAFKALLMAKSSTDFSCPPTVVEGVVTAESDVVCFSDCLVSRGWASSLSLVA